MNTKIIDLLENKITAIKPGQGKCICKFVLIVHNDELYLVFGLVSEFPYHANLVDLFCNRFSIPSGWSKKPDLVEILDENCSLNGGGWIEIDPTLKRMKFFGRSTAYGKYSKSDLNHVLTGHRLFTNYKVIVSH